MYVPYNGRTIVVNGTIEPPDVRRRMGMARWSGNDQPESGAK